MKCKFIITDNKYIALSLINKVAYIWCECMQVSFHYDWLTRWHALGMTTMNASKSAKTTAGYYSSTHIPIQGHNCVPDPGVVSVSFRQAQCVFPSRCQPRHAAAFTSPWKDSARWSAASTALWRTAGRWTWPGSEGLQPCRWYLGDRLCRFCGWQIVQVLWVTYCTGSVGDRLYRFCGWHIVQVLWVTDCTGSVGDRLYRFCGWHIVLVLWVTDCTGFVGDILYWFCGWQIVQALWVTDSTGSVIDCTGFVGEKLYMLSGEYCASFVGNRL